MRKVVILLLALAAALALGAGAARADDGPCVGGDCGGSRALREYEVKQETAGGTEREGRRCLGVA